MPKISEEARYTVETHIVKKNTIVVKYFKGEREATAIVKLARSGDTERTRRGNAENLARSLAIEAWEREWGDLPWDLMQAVVTYTTFQVVYSLRTEGRD